jgi:hypothetical protein
MVWSRLALAAAHGLCGMLRARAACSLVDAAIAISCGLLVVLFAPLLASLGTRLNTLDGNARRRFPIAARGRLKLGRLGAGGIMGGVPMLFFGGGPGSVDRHEESM